MRKFASARCGRGQTTVPLSLFEARWKCRQRCLRSRHISTDLDVKRKKTRGKKKQGQQNKTKQNAAAVAVVVVVVVLIGGHKYKTELQRVERGVLSLSYSALSFYCLRQNMSSVHVCQAQLEACKRAFPASFPPALPPKPTSLFCQTGRPLHCTT